MNELKSKTYFLIEYYTNISTFYYKDEIKSRAIRYFFDKFDEGFSKSTSKNLRGLIYLKIQGVGIDIYREKGIEIMEHSYDMSLLSDTGLLSEPLEDLTLVKPKVNKVQPKLEQFVEHPLLNYNLLIRKEVNDLKNLINHILENGLKKNEAEYIIHSLSFKKTNKNKTYYQNEVIPKLIKESKSSEIDLGKKPPIFDVIKSKNIQEGTELKLNHAVRKNALKVRHLDFGEEYTDQETYFLKKGFNNRNQADYLRYYRNNPESVETEYFNLRVENEIKKRVETFKDYENKALQLIYYIVAIFNFNKVIERSDSNWMADQNIAYCYFKSGNFTQAIEHFELMINQYEKLDFPEKNDKLSTTYESFAAVYKNDNYDNRSYAKSIKLMEKALEYSPLAPDLHCSYIDVCCKNKDATKAFDFLKSIAEEKSTSIYELMIEYIKEDSATKLCFNYIYNNVPKFKSIVNNKLNGFIDPEIFFNN